MKSANRLLKLLTLFFIIFLLTGCHYGNVEKITIAGSDLVAVGKSIQLEIVTEPATARYRSAIWESSNPEIAVVTAGKVTGVAVGTVEITVTIGKTAAVHGIRVIDPGPGGAIFAGVNVIGNAFVNRLAEISLLERTEGYIVENFNPYDYAMLNVYAVFTAPSGKTWTIPAFWYRDYYFTFDEDYRQTSGISGVASTDPDEPQGLE
ncbi:MAG: Ig-like domain-containing protein, partial [Endomicrobiaceae bacterium]|nr:Ig-like domain-containing protein [Endomicrobiaceae bacterium]